MRKDPSTQSYAWNMSTRATFFAALTCLAHPPGKTPSSSLPANSAVVLTTFADFRSHGYQPNGARVDPTRVPAFGANVSTMPEETRGGGFEPMYPSGAVWAPSAECSDSPVLLSQRRNGGSVHRGCNGRGRCMLQPGATAGTCICVDGAYGAHCEHVCQNDCFHDCSGHGECVHGFCRCDDGFFGVDCSDTFEAHVGRRSSMHFDRRQFGAGPVGLGGRTRLRQLPRQIQKHIERLYHSVYVYDLPAAVNRDGAKWMTRYWGVGSFTECDPVHERRIYSAQTHFDGHLFHDDYVRTLDPRQAKLFYVPIFLAQRHTWGGRGAFRSLEKLLAHIKHAHPYWNASGGRDHVFFVFGEKLVCEVPKEMQENAILISHWGGRKGFTRAASDCVDPDKDIVVPPITPIQHDFDKYERLLAPAMRKADSASFERNGALLLFCGGIMSFGASQDHRRSTGVDSAEMQQKLLAKTLKLNCADPAESVRNVNCRMIYSMGVRQALWRQKLWADPSMRIVSAGIPDYLSAVPSARFCLHTEGNSWGTRLMDYMAVECLPVIVNDGMVFPFAKVLPYKDFSLHLSRAEIPRIKAHLLNVSNETQRAMHAAVRRFKRAFIWFRPDGLAYEYTLAELGERLARLQQKK